MNPTSCPAPRPARVRTSLTRGLLPTGLLALLLVSGGCGAGAGADESSGSTTADAAGTTDGGAAEASGPESPEGADDSGSAGGGGSGEAVATDGTGPVRGVAGVPAGPGAQVAAAERAIISTGTVAVQAPDVAGALAEVQQVADRVRGQVTERSSESDDRGGLTRARLVLRVPAASFGTTMADLEATAELLSSDSDSQDVTTQVIDTDARVEVARRSIDRVAVLLGQAESIADVVSIEAQLARREADLASLVQQQTYLGDQSSLSTITVSLRRTPEEPEPPVETEAAGGFVAGLSSGWDALSGAGLVALTVLGAVLPWLGLALLVGLPGAALARRLRRRTPGTPGAQAASAGPAT